MRRVLGRRLGPPRPSGPYRGAFSPPYNATSELPIPSPILGVDAMHPDVVDFGTAWNGYRYWMAFTPYNGNEQTEVPSIVATNDITGGGTWVVPAGFTNPITADPAGLAHMADTDLAYDDNTDRLHVLYVYTDESSYQDIRAKSTDGGGTWSSETVVLTAPLATAYGNPSVIRTDAGWRMYYNKGADGLFYRDTTTDPGSGYGSEVSAPLDLDYGTVAARFFQNLNVVKDTDGAHVAVISDSNTSTVDGTLLFARSTDGGDTWKLTGPPVLNRGPAANWDGEGIYRASLVTTPDGVVVLDGTDLHLFYSAYTTSATQWGTGYTQIPVECIRF